VIGRSADLPLASVVLRDHMAHIASTGSDDRALLLGRLRGELRLSWDRPTVVSRALLPLFLVLSCIGCTSTASTSPRSSATPTTLSDRSSTSAAPTHRGDVEATTTTAVDDLTDLVARDWLVIASTGTERDARAFPAHLRFTDDGRGVGTVQLTGCDIATFPVTFGPSHLLDVGRPAALQGCEGSLDIGQAIPNMLELPLQWSIEGDQLNLIPTVPSDYSLVLVED
jgi:hypothetical protein